MSRKAGPAARPFCFYTKVYLPAHDTDAFLSRVVAPWAEESVASGGFEDFFFIRYADPERHVRLRLFGARGAVLGAPRRRALESLSRSAAAYPGAALKPSRYRPEWGRYGGRAGMRAAERVFVASSRCVLEFLKLRAAGLQTSKVEFALATGEMLLDALGLSRPERDAVFKPYTRAPLPAQDDAAAAFAHAVSPLLAKAVPDPREYWGEGDAALGRLARGFYGSLDPVRAAWPALKADLTRPLHVLAQSYLHMHYNRLGISPLQERLIRQFRGEFDQRRAGSETSR